MVKNPVLVALDVPTAEAAVRLAKDLIPYVGGFKVGLELMMGPGPGVVAAVGELGLPVFADAKLHDIPNTVAGACRQLGRYGARWVTVHASGAKSMLEAAVESLGSTNPAGGVLAITVLTSLEATDLARVGIIRTPGKQVSKLAAIANEAGVEGVVCPVGELHVVTQIAPGLTKVTPGVRPAGADPDDQAQVATPEEAIEKGADLIVIGRPITRAADPVATAREIAIGLGVAPD